MTVARLLHRDRCYRCGITETFVEWIDDVGSTVDTAYGMRFDAGWLCDNCLGAQAVMDSNLALARWAHTKGEPNG